jgi:hypothetical protein
MNQKVSRRRLVRLSRRLCHGSRCRGGRLGDRSCSRDGSRRSCCWRGGRGSCRGSGWFGRSGRFRWGSGLRWRRTFWFNASFPGRTRIHVSRQALCLPFFFEIGGGLIRCFTDAHHIVPRINFRSDLAARFSPSQIQRDGITPVGPKKNMDGSNVLEQ